MFWSRAKVPAESAVTGADVAELVQRIKVLEREFEDLHACYRRLRAASGGAQRVENLVKPRTDERGDGDDEGLSHKEALRRRAGIARGAIARFGKNQ